MGKWKDKNVRMHYIQVGKKKKIYICWFNLHFLDEMPNIDHFTNNKNMENTWKFSNIYAKLVFLDLILLKQYRQKNNNFYVNLIKDLSNQTIKMLMGRFSSFRFSLFYILLLAAPFLYIYKKQTLENEEQKKWRKKGTVREP